MGQLDPALTPSTVRPSNSPMRTMLIVSTLVLLPVLEPGVQGDLQPAQLQQDFDLLKSALEEAHGGLYRFSAKAELDRHFDRARAKLDRPMPTLQFIGIVSEALTG